jgi:hypothetical protein
MRARLVGIWTLAVLVLALGASAQAGDSQIGTWELNVAKSTYSPGPAPKSNKIKIEAAGANGITLTGHGVGADGKPTHISYTADYDGKDAAMTTGESGAQTIALKRVDANTVETTNKRDGKVVGTGRAVISAEGKTRTYTMTGTTVDGKPLKNVRVYNKK